MEIDKNRKIIVFGVSFSGIDEIIMYAMRNKPKAGVFVGEDSHAYPCFDSSDYAYENRRFWNFIFAKTQVEVKDKLDALENIKTGGNYNKLACDFYPMIYWGGDMTSPMEIGECEEIVIPAVMPSQKNRDKSGQVRLGKSRMEQLYERLKEDNINKK